MVLYIDLLLDDGTIIDIIVTSQIVQERHYFYESSRSNQYTYDNKGNIKFFLEKYGNIILKEIRYDSAGNILREEKGRVFDAVFSLEQVKELMKKVYNVNLDTLVQRSIFYYFEDIYEKKSVYKIKISPPEKSLAEERIIVIDGNTGEIISDELIFGEY